MTPKQELKNWARPLEEIKPYNRIRFIREAETETINIVQKIIDRTDNYYFHITEEMERFLLEEINKEIIKIKCTN